MIKVLREKLPQLFSTLSDSYPLYLPIKKANEVNYGLYTEGVEVSLDTLKTVKSAKDFFFPQSETMMGFKTNGNTIDIVDTRTEREQFILFGVRACDFKSFEVLDNVFLSEPVDTLYKARRDAGIIVTMACSKPEMSCFCNVFGIDATAPKGDITSWLDESYLYLSANTDKGNAVLSKIEFLGESGGEEQVKAQRDATREVVERLPYSHLDLSTFKEENLNELFNSAEWKDLSEACLGCGACTFVCPTCQCFDIRDFKTNSGVVRFRCWDSCMYSDFTQMAAANSRTTQLQRYRQRFMHKLVYYPSQYGGTFSCVGCGRCVNKCPQHLNIIKVIKRLGGQN